MRKGWMSFVGFLGVVLLAGGIYMIARHSINFLIVGSCIAMSGFGVFSYAVYHYALGSAIISLPRSGVAYQISSLAQFGESGDKHLVLLRLDEREDSSLWFRLEADKIPKGVGPGDEVVRIGQGLIFLEEKQFPVQESDAP